VGVVIRKEKTPGEPGVFSIKTFLAKQVINWRGKKVDHKESGN
jgi:hypothetical protein